MGRSNFNGARRCRKAEREEEGGARRREKKFGFRFLFFFGGGGEVKIVKRSMAVIISRANDNESEQSAVDKLRYHRIESNSRSWKGFSDARLQVYPAKRIDYVCVSLKYCIRLLILSIHPLSSSCLFSSDR